MSPQAEQPAHQRGQKEPSHAPRSAQPNASPTVPLLKLQHSMGNRAVVNLISAQRKLIVGSAGDDSEREADEIAHRVSGFLRSGQSRPNAPQTDPNAVIGRLIRRRAVIGAEGGEIDAETEMTLNAEVSRGRPLDNVARTSMESAFGVDFNDVRVHEGATSADLNERLQAKAFTVGSDIFFRSSVPSVATSEGQELLAHELTHVVQQSGGAQRVASRLVDPDDAKHMRPDTRNPKIDAPDDRIDIDKQVEEGEEEEQEELGKDRLLDREAQEAEAEEQEVARELVAFRVRRANKLKAKAAQVRRDFTQTRDFWNQMTTNAPTTTTGPAPVGPSAPPAVSITRQNPAGPNGVSGIDPDDYGFCETEDIGEPDIAVTATRDGSIWRAELTTVNARYSKIIQLPLDGGVQCQEITGPGGGGPGATTLRNSRDQIEHLLAHGGPRYYMASAVDAHESVHEGHLLQALTDVAPQLQAMFNALTVQAGGTVRDRSSALAAIKALPGYAAAVAQLRDVWDAQYCVLINPDHWGPTQDAEKASSNP